MATPFPPCELVRTGSRLIGRCRPGAGPELNDPGELGDARFEPLEAGFEPVEWIVRPVHSSSVDPRDRDRIRGWNDRRAWESRSRVEPRVCPGPLGNKT